MTIPDPRWLTTSPPIAVDDDEGEAPPPSSVPPTEAEPEETPAQGSQERSP